MMEATAIVLLVFSIVTYLWAVVGLINPQLVKLPNRLSSVGVWAASFGMLIFGIALLPSPPVDAEIPVTPSLTEPVRPPLVVSSAELLRAFEENEIRAEQMYGGRVLEVTGTINSIEGDAVGDGGFIEFRGGELWTDVQAHYPDGSVLASLSRGQSISVMCRDVDGGNIMGVRLRDCEVPRIGTRSAEAVNEVKDAGIVSSTVGVEVSAASDAPPDTGVDRAPPRVALPEELLQAFDENEVRAQQTYGRQRLQVIGVIDSIEGNSGGFGGFIEFEGGSFLRDVEAHFDDRSVLTELSRAERVTVVCGEVDGGNIMGVRMRDCELSQMEAARVYVAALEANPERVDALFRLSLAQMRAGADNAARESFADLLDAGHPLELNTIHRHTFGDCEGMLTLTNASVSFRSPQEDGLDHRFDVPLDEIVETGMRDESLLIRAPSAEHVEKNEMDSKNWTFRFDAWDANTEIVSLISGHLSAGP